VTKVKDKQTEHSQQSTKELTEDPVVSVLSSVKFSVCTCIMVARITEVEPDDVYRCPKRCISSLEGLANVDLVFNAIV